MIVWRILCALIFVNLLGSWPVANLILCFSVQYSATFIDKWWQCEARHSGKSRIEKKVIYLFIESGNVLGRGQIHSAWSQFCSAHNLTLACRAELLCELRETLGVHTRRVRAAARVARETRGAGRVGLRMNDSCIFLGGFGLRPRPALLTPSSIFISESMRWSWVRAGAAPQVRSFIA